MPIAQDNTLGNLGSILQSIPGLSQAINGETSTSSTAISSQGLNYLLQQILSGTNGLASVAGGQNTAGLYNSTVQTQMVNDLLARSAGEVASKTATTTTTKAPTLNLGDTLLQGAAGLIGTKLLSTGVDKLGGSVMDALGLSGTTTAGGEAAGASLLSATGATPSAFAAAGGSVPTAVANAALSAGATAIPDAAGAGSAVAGATGAGVDSAIGATGAGVLDAGAAAGLGLGTAGAIGSATAGGLAAGGATLGGLGGAIAGDVAAATSGIAAGAGVGAGAAGGAAAAGGIGDALASVGAALAWVVCTELETQGALSHETYNKAAPDFVSRMRLKPSAVRGYHYWAVPYTKLMRRKDLIGRIARAAIKPLAVGRADFINGRWNLLGWVTFNILEPICSALGKTVARRPQDWKVLYKKGE
jgi:hypothetical protein